MFHASQQVLKNHTRFCQAFLNLIMKLGIAVLLIWWWNCRYGDAKRCCADIYIPSEIGKQNSKHTKQIQGDNNNKYPVAVFCHGGIWAIGLSIKFFLFEFSWSFECEEYNRVCLCVCISFLISSKLCASCISLSFIRKSFLKSLINTISHNIFCNISHPVMFLRWECIVRLFLLGEMRRFLAIKKKIFNIQVKVGNFHQWQAGLLKREF